MCNGFNKPIYVDRPLCPIETSDRFELVCYDIAGPFLPKNIRGNLYALIIVDHFTKWTEILPLKDVTAPAIAKAIFHQWICRYGVMSKLHSDGANNVHVEVIKELCAQMCTTKSKSSRLHPQGDGMAEATIKIVKSSIKKQVDEFGQDWDLYLHPTAFAIRTSINNSTRHTPGDLGDNFQRLIDISAKQLHPTTSQRSYKEFATSLGAKLNMSIEIVHRNSQHARNKMKQNYDKHNSHHQIQEGNNVMLWWPYFKKGISRFFQSSWKGPFIVEKLIGKTNCKIRNENGKEQCVHLNQLKLTEARNTYPVYKCKSKNSNKKSYISFDELSHEDNTAEYNNRNDDSNPIINHG